jgi:hypothetical protein
LWVMAPDPKSVRQLADTNYATSVKEGGKFIDNSQIRNSLFLL